jgi:hypothetical protein
MSQPRRRAGMAANLYLAAHMPGEKAGLEERSGQGQAARRPATQQLPSTVVCGPRRTLAERQGEA